MTDKEQIIIDGIDVSECLFYQANFEEDYDVKIKHFCSNWHNSCESVNNSNCYYKQLTRKTQECDTLKSQLDFEVQQKEGFEQECEELKRKFSNQEQLYQNEIEIYNKSCLQLRQENDDLYLERLALNTANSGINALLEVKEQESNRYRKAFEEIEEYVQSQLDGFGNDVYLMNKAAINKILDIINKAKGEGNEI